MVGGLGYLVETCSICLIFHHELFQRIQRELDVNWYSFPVTAVTNYHRHNGLKQCKFISTQFWRPEVLQQGQAPSWGCKGDFIPYLSCFRWLLACLDIVWLVAASPPSLSLLSHCLHLPMGLSFVDLFLYSCLCFISVFIVVQLLSCIWLCDPMDCSMPGFLILCLNSCPLSCWCHPAISSSVALFLVCLWLHLGPIWIIQKGPTFSVFYLSTFFFFAT